ncbi:MAG TPA: NADPH:quinone oxidoreductase family protein [Terriglobales bacterium]|nr:NADPH:quinone oxidoreductase family protein [Terriglobales bacterium]
MRAVFVTRLGGPEVLQIHEAPEPQVRPGKVLVEIEAAGVNFADAMMARGTYPGTPQPPFIAGREFCGTIVDSINSSGGRSTSTGASGFSPGDRVMGYCQGAAFAERVAVSANSIWPAPKNWTAVEAAAFPVNFFTAYLAFWKAGLTDVGDSARRPRVLIHAVAGGVGTAAVEIAKILGIETYGTSSSDEKLSRMRQLGLNHGINYKQDDYEEAIQKLTDGEGVDAVFEMLGGEHTAKSTRCLAFLGRVILYGTATGVQPQFDVRTMYTKQASVHGLWLSPLASHKEVMEPAWQRMKEWIDSGKLRPVVGHTLPLHRAGDAFRLLLERKNFGKVVLTV